MESKASAQAQESSFQKHNKTFATAMRLSARYLYLAPSLSTMWHMARGRGVRGNLIWISRGMYTGVYAGCAWDFVDDWPQVKPLD